LKAVACPVNNNAISLNNKRITNVTSKSASNVVNTNGHALRGWANRSTPGYLIYFVTARCNCRCKMCFNYEAIDSANTRNELTFSEVEQITRNFPGLHQVNFSGGEPFLREDFARIPKLFYTHSGTRFFTCPTNSSRPEHIESAVGEMCRSCPDAWIRITQSLDGGGADHHRLRGTDGLFDRVVDLNGRPARLVRRHANLSAGLTTVVSKLNREHLYDTLEFVYDNLEFTDYGALLVRGETRERDARDVSAEEYREYLDASIARRRARPVRNSLATRAFTAIGHTTVDLIAETAIENRFISPCTAGKRMVVMGDEGVVTPCEVLENFIREGRMDLETARLGNIRDYDYDIRKLLGTPRAQAIVHAITAQRCYCTFECAWSVNVLYTPGLWARVFRNFCKLG